MIMERSQKVGCQTQLVCHFHVKWLRLSHQLRIQFPYCTSIVTLEEVDVFSGLFRQTLIAKDLPSLIEPVMLAPVESIIILSPD